MRRSTLLLVALLGLAAAVQAKTIAEVARERLDAAREVVKERDFGHGNVVKALFGVQKDGDTDESSNKRHLLTTGAFMQAANERWNTFLESMMGRDWSQYVPQAWRDRGYSLEALGTFDFQSNIQDFLAMDMQRPTTAAELHTSIKELEGVFCKPETFTPSELVYATCVGPQVTLSYRPKVCILEETTKEIVCDPPKIVLIRTPGGCTHKYHSASTWTGKECKISGQAGFTKEITYGGGSYQLPLASISFDWDTTPTPP